MKKRAIVKNFKIAWTSSARVGVNELINMNGRWDSSVYPALRASRQSGGSLNIERSLKDAAFGGRAR